METIDELASFILPETRLDVKTLALHHILSMTGSFESREILLKNRVILENIETLAFRNEEQNSIKKDAFLTLINLAAEEFNAKALLYMLPSLVGKLIDYICDATSKHADAACAILSNLSRGSQTCKQIAKYFCTSDTNNNDRQTHTLESLLKVFCSEGYNPTNSLNYLAPFICNLTQVEEIRNIIVSKDVILLRLLPYTTYQKSIIRRGGIIGAIKNCCFNYDVHERLLLSPEIDLLSRLLLPLAGPEEFDAEDNEKLPEDLQYLPPTKEREQDADIRIMILEILMMLVSRKKNREFVKEKNAYVIIRELHSWEKDEKTLSIVEKLVHFLISDEPESGMEDLDKVMIPENLSKKFYDFDIKHMGESTTSD